MESSIKSSKRHIFKIFTCLDTSADVLPEVWYTVHELAQDFFIFIDSAMKLQIIAKAVKPVVVLRFIRSLIILKGVEFEYVAEWGGVGVAVVVIVRANRLANLFTL
ncbi:hypothetical protein Ccrd_004303 [Cynara cardunculus var. scolymus]|uniref:Uncharacterized protein n=1 Tax=Cynara cardunculus var. scolymus TaxID=59895 RepID=A0A103XMZ5_CYNCS|nr:hypothetical protein Ccrd_004303 [Cynara cardunculus var. scolymus]